MGLVYAKVKVINNDNATLNKKGCLAENKTRKGEHSILFDSGAYMLLINKKVKNQLGLESFGKDSFELADESIKQYNIVGPVMLKFENRKTVCQALVPHGNFEMLLGAFPMKDMDVIIHPRTQTLSLHPGHHYIPQKALK